MASSEFWLQSSVQELKVLAVQEHIGPSSLVASSTGSRNFQEAT